MTESHVTELLLLLKDHNRATTGKYECPRKKTALHFKIGSIPPPMVEGLENNAEPQNPWGNFHSKNIDWSRL